MFNKRIAYYGLAAIAVTYIMVPDFSTNSRMLSTSESRAVQEVTPAPTPPPEVAFSCREGQAAFRVHWGETEIKTKITPQHLMLSNGMNVTLEVTETGNGHANNWGLTKEGYLQFTAGKTITADDVVKADGSSHPDYPAGYATMEFTFEDGELDGLYISISDIDSNSNSADAVRIRMYNEDGDEVETEIATTGTIATKDNFGYEKFVNVRAQNPGFEASLYAKALGHVKKIALDQSIYSFRETKVGHLLHRSIYPALDFAYCADTMPPSMSPFPSMVPTGTGVGGGGGEGEEEEEEPAPAPAPETDVPVTAPETDMPVTAPETDMPVTAPETDAPAPAPAPGSSPAPGPVDVGGRSGDKVCPAVPEGTTGICQEQCSATKPCPEQQLCCYNGCGHTCTAGVPKSGGPGVNGDPLIMGLSGQVFKFEGRTGAWYSAVSTDSFQWNLKTQKFEDCPERSDTFVTGVGLTIFHKGKKKHQIEINVVNEHHVNIGCGHNKGIEGCLGAGSLELVIDGKKSVAPGDTKFKDGSGRVVAFNTFFQCSRKWFDFRINDDSRRSISPVRGRSLKDPSVFALLDELKDTMIDKRACDQWLKKRKSNNDLFKQGGHWSTIIIKTEKIALHVEYKQESDRCNAHDLDVWISSVNPDVLQEQWEGIIGETKDLTYHGNGEIRHQARDYVLKYNDDAAYEVISPFSTKCKGCSPRK